MIAEDRKHGTRTDHVRIFDSAAEFLEYCKGPSEMPTSDRTSRRRSTGWAGTRGWTEATKLAASGWNPEPTERVRTRRAIETRLRDSIRKQWRTKTDYRGSAPHIGRALQGHPRAMRRKLLVQRSKRNRPVRILANVGFNAGTNGQLARGRGYIIAALVDAIKRSGQPVEVYIAQSTSGYNTTARLVYVVPIVQAGQPIDMGRLTYYVAHESVLRRLGFSACERENHAIRSAFGIRKHGGYGRAESVPDAILADYGDVYFDAIRHDEAADPDAMADKVLSSLKSLDIITR